ncbi:MAG: hypothetical protein BWY15_00007 [Firmicutes bacterium ADurb.Bin193]|nr:MAG: hypothetical protein BWY15_00007 [Firmicutes bacterium ADurb.Bin193]
MRKVHYGGKSFNSGSGRKRNVLLVVTAVFLLLTVFFLSFIIAYNVMKNDRMGNQDNLLADLQDEEAGSVSAKELPEDVAELQRMVEALNNEIEELNAQVDKYKALAEMRSGNIPVEKPNPTIVPVSTASPRPTAAPSHSPSSVRPSPTPKPSTTPSSSPSKEPSPTPTPTQSPAVSPAVSEKPTPAPMQSDGTIDGI